MEELHEKKAHLTSAEIANLWVTYINDSLVICILTHFLHTVEDPDVALHLDHTIQVSTSHLLQIKEIFEKEGIAVPKGFPVEEHVILSAPRLFSDMFYMEYLLHMSKFGLTSHAAAIAISSRDDIRSLYETYFEEAEEVNREVTKLMKKKGIYIRPPYMNYPKSVDFIKDQGFLTGWLGKKRPLLANEVSHLYLTSLHNQVGKSTLIGLAQVAQDVQLKEYFRRGLELSTKILNDVHKVFQESDIPNSMTWDTNVSESTIPPYSDQVMLFLVSALSQIGVAAYGMALSLSLRRDLGGLYSRFILKALTYSEDGAQMMIERGWLEQPPIFADRNRLINGK